MTPDEAKKYILAHAVEALTPDGKSQHKDIYSLDCGFVCPVCGSGEGPDGTGLRRPPEDPLHFHCFSAKCSFRHGDIFDLLAMKDGLSSKALFPQKLENACRYFNITLDHPTTSYNGNAPRSSSPSLEVEPDDLSGEIMSYHDDLSACNYLTKRGLSEETQNKFMCGFCANWSVKPGAPTSARIIIPSGPDSYLARAISDNTPAPKITRGKKALFNRYALTKEKVFVVEGEIDAMSIEELGFPSIGLASASNLNLLIEALEDIEIIDRPTLILALDNDTGGKKAAIELMKRLNKLGVIYTAPAVDELYSGAKDANEALLNGRDAFKERLAAAMATDPYQSKSASSETEALLNDLKNNTRPAPISTGIWPLDEAIEGGLYAGLYVMGAISSLGKTTLMLQIADNIAAAGHDVLIFALEMSRRELIAKSISRLTAKACASKGIKEMNATARSVRDILSGQNNATQYAAILEAIKAYREFSDRVFILEGLGDIGIEQITNSIVTHIAARKQKPVVFIDYLQIIHDDDTRKTDKQRVDDAVLALKRLSRDYALPVFTVSSFNRDNYKAEVDMTAFKESGAIEYGSDVLIGLQLGIMSQNRKISTADLKEEKRKEPRSISLEVLKNRNGRPNGTVNFNFYKRFNWFDADR